MTHYPQITIWRILSRLWCLPPLPLLSVGLNLLGRIGLAAWVATSSLTMEKAQKGWRYNDKHVRRRIQGRISVGRRKQVEEDFNMPNLPPLLTPVWNYSLVGLLLQPLVLILCHDSVSESVMIPWLLCSFHVHICFHEFSSPFLISSQIKAKCVKRVQGLVWFTVYLFVSCSHALVKWWRKVIVSFLQLQ